MKDRPEDRAEREGVAGPPTNAEAALYGFVRRFLVIACGLYFRLSAEGTEHIPATGAFVLAPVHRSNLDFAVVATLTERRMRYMGKDSLWKTKPAAWFLSALGGFPVNRATADREALRTCIAVVQAGEPVVLFAEGQRRSGPVVTDIFDGPAYVAGRCGVPVIPVGIGGSERAMPKGAKFPRPVHIHLVVGPALYPAAPKEPGRVSRRATRELSEQLHLDLQRLYDTSQVRAGA